MVKRVELMEETRTMSWNEPEWDMHTVLGGFILLLIDIKHTYPTPAVMFLLFAVIFSITFIQMTSQNSILGFECSTQWKVNLTVRCSYRTRCLHIEQLQMRLCKRRLTESQVKLRLYTRALISTDIKATCSDISVTWLTMRRIWCFVIKTDSQLCLQDIMLAVHVSENHRYVQGCNF